MFNELKNDVCCLNNKLKGMQDLVPEMPGGDLQMFFA